MAGEEFASCGVACGGKLLATGEPSVLGDHLVIDLMGDQYGLEIPREQGELRNHRQVNEWTAIAHNSSHGWVCPCGGLNTASGTDSSVSGGQGNRASGFAASVSGGLNRTAPGEFDWVAGPLFADE